MDTELENPVITDEVEAKFLEAAALADAGQDIPAGLVPAESADAATATEKKEEKPSGITPDNSETDPEKKDDRPRDELGRFTKKEDGTDIPEAERQPAEKPAAKPTDQQPSEYEAKKQEQRRGEEERKDRSWKAINERKEVLDRFQAELNQRAAELQQQRNAPPVPQIPVDEDGEPITSKALMRAHKDFNARAKESLKRYQETGNDADLDAFNEQQALAENAFESAQQVYQMEQQRDQQIQLHQYNQVWNGHMQKAIEADPDLVKQHAPLAKAVHSLLETHGQVFWMIPDGFAKAVEVAKMRLEAGSASELREANNKLQAEVERLNGLTSISGSGPTSQPAPKKFEDMSDEEQNAYFLRAAQAVDNGQLT